jgi:hypothetical protein
VLIAEMLVLVTIKDNGHVPVRNNITKAAVSGALLAELAMDRKLTLAKGGTLRAAGARPRDELLADVYDATRNHLDGRKAVLVISGLSRHIGGSWNRVGDRLVDAGVLGRHRPLGLLMTRYPVIGRPPGGPGICAGRGGGPLAATARRRGRSVDSRGMPPAEAGCAGSPRSP